MKKPPKIMREFHIRRREDFTMIYPFMTYVSIFDPVDIDRPNLRKLNNYFKSIITLGAASPEGKGSVSKGKKLMIDIKLIDSDLIRYAYEANYEGLGSAQHEKVQMYLHANDPFTYATEIPVWSAEEEIADCKYCNDEITHCDECHEFDRCKRHQYCDHLLHGHIDIIRYLPDDTIEIPDFKPNAEKETKAASQVWKYMWLLSLRTGIDIKDMKGLYFDGYCAYSLNI